jgi:hypothetical protein
MRVDFYGLHFETPGVSFYLWSPWRCSDLEHRVFKSLEQVPGIETDHDFDEHRLHVMEPRAWKAAVQAIARVLKGWQEEASDAGSERRAWRWLMEADTDPDGFDHTGERVSMWAFLRVTLDRSNPGDAEKPEDIDLDGFGVRIWGEQATRRQR